MDRVSLTALVTPLLALATACAPEPVTLSVDFPNEEAFLYAETARLLMVELGEDQRDQCPSIVNFVANGVGSWDQQIAAEVVVPVCELRQGGTELTDVGEGLWAFVALIQALNSRPLLSGCTVAETYVDAPVIQIQLSGAPQGYADVIADLGPPACRTAEDKCQGTCL